MSARRDFFMWVPSWLGTENLQIHLHPSELLKELSRSFNPELLLVARDRIASFLAGRTDLSGLELYRLLERASALVWLHLIPRNGPRNCLRSGLQQSYGDHTRLLLAGLDAFEREDAGWFLSRTERKGELTEDDIRNCILTYKKFEFRRRDLVDLWLAASLHDFGKLAAPATSLDSEYAGTALFSILGELLPEDDHSEDDHRSKVLNLIRYHDAVEYIITGESPVEPIAASLQIGSNDHHRIEGASLGLIQFSGAASLGEGRLNQRKLDIYQACCSGKIFQRGNSLRAARLLFGESSSPPAPQLNAVEKLLSDFEADTAEELSLFLSRTFVPGWWKSAHSLASYLEPGEVVDGRLDLLTKLAKRVNKEEDPTEYLIIEESFVERLAAAFREGNRVSRDLIDWAIQDQGTFPTGARWIALS